jgi:HK97 family phage major capsid protein
MKTRWTFFAVAVAVVAVLSATVTPEVMAAYMDPQLVGSVMLATGVAALAPADYRTSKELRAQRAGLVEENRKVLDRISAEKDAARVKELETEWEKRDADIETLGKRIDRVEKQERLDAEMAEPANERRSGRQASGGQPLSDEQRKEQVERYRKAYWASLSGLPISADDQRLLNSRFRTVRGEFMDVNESRAMSTTVAAGGYAIPEGFVADMEVTMLAFGGVRPVARILRTAKGNTLPWPTANHTTLEAAIIGEGSALSSPNDPTFGVVSFGAYTYRALALASIELLQDEGVGLEGYIRAAIAEQFARGTNRHYTTGNGSSQPQGFIPGSSSGVTAASATSVSYADLVDLEHSLDPAYRNGASFQMRDSTIKIIKKLEDNDGRPLWASGIAVREPNTILGYPYAFNEHMAAVAASNKSVAFGNFSKFVIRDVTDLLIVRANELHIGNGQVGFYAFFRTDAKVLDAGTDPIKHLTHPSPN